MSTFDNNIMDWDSAIESDGSQFIASARRRCLKT